MSHDYYMTTRDKFATAIAPSRHGLFVHWGVAAAALAVAGALTGGLLGIGLLVGAGVAGYKGVAGYMHERSDETKAKREQMMERQRREKEMSDAFERQVDGPAVSNLEGPSLRQWAHQVTQRANSEAGREL